jgi:hypothetical protein
MRWSIKIEFVQGPQKLNYGSGKNDTSGSDRSRFYCVGSCIKRSIRVYTDIIFDVISLLLFSRNQESDVK